jgi:hypothetical protein
LSTLSPTQKPLQAVPVSSPCETLVKQGQLLSYIFILQFGHQFINPSSVLQTGHLPFGSDKDIRPS